MSNWGTSNNAGGFNLDWEYASNGQVPSGAVEGGRDANGETYYVGRARQNGNNFLVPGKVQPSHKVIYYPFEGAEKSSNNYEVLVNRSGREHLSWIQSSGKNIPPNAVLCGHQENNEQIYIGRHMHEGALVIGKVQPSHGCLYIAFNGREVCYKDYEILVSNETPAFNPSTFMGDGHSVGTANVSPSSGGPPVNPWGGAAATAATSAASSAFNPNSDNRRNY